MPSFSEATLTNMTHEASNEWLDRPKYEDAERQYHEQLAAAAKVPTCEGVRPPQTPLPSTSAPPTGGTTSARKQQLQTPPPKQQRTQHQEGKAEVGDTATVTTKPPQQGKKEKRSKKNENKEGAKVTAAAKKVADKQSQPPVGTKIAVTAGGQTPAELNQKIAELEAETDRLNKVTDDLRALVLKLETRVSSLEKSPSAPRVATTPTAAVKQPAPSSSKKDVAKDDEVDLFASDEEDDEDKERLHQERLNAYEAKKSKKPALIAKSNIILDIKPWDDETDMKEMEKQVRTVAMDGLIWGASKLVPLAYGIHKLQISCVVEDDKVSVDLLQEQIEAFEELVQSVDIAAFNKV